ncbi:MAG: MtnX-like HAD-IB family phosphatase [Acidobacteriota bacterium]|nr:MtnX-like HAD-IB family phosphatase [Acidobacteriota bacterium]
MFLNEGTPILFVDFDGTISKRDVIDRILEEFADDRWLETEEKWVSGEIGSRTCLQEQFSYVKAAPEQLNEFLDTLELDEGFSSLLDFCCESDIKIHVVSDGFDYYIRRMLEKAVINPQQLARINIWANRLTTAGENLWRTDFPFFEKVCGDGCATCKPAVMRRQNPYAAPSVFVGDGLSDRFAAQAADIVFAKGKLKDFCRQIRIPLTEYANLRQVAESLDAAYESFALLTLSGKQTNSWIQAA